MKTIKILYLAIPISLISCGFDPSSVRAKAGAPAPAVVDQIHIPYDSSHPRYVLAVEEVSLPGTTVQWKSSYVNSAQINGKSSSNTQGRTDSGTTTDIGEKKNSWKRTGSKILNQDQQDPSSKSKQNTPSIGSAPGSIPVAFNSNTSDNDLNQPPIKDEMALGSEVSNSRAVATTNSINKQNSASRNSQNIRATGEAYNTRIDSQITEGARDTAAQFVSSLTSVDNFSVRSFNTLKVSSGGLYSAQMKSGEVGPFIVRAVFTEYEARVVDKSSKNNILTLVRTADDLQEGVVGLDVSVTDGRSGEILASFPVQGTFSSRNNKFGVGVLIPFHEQKQFAQSVLAQARRNALNEAAQRIYQVLTKKVRS